MNLTRDQIREVFMSHGFTIKEGQTDLKTYVYEAAESLLALAERALEPQGQALPELPEPWIRDMDAPKGSRDHFAADQMHAYARAYASQLALPAGPVPEDVQSVNMSEEHVQESARNEHVAQPSAWRIDWPASHHCSVGGQRWCGADDFARKDLLVSIGGTAVPLYELASPAVAQPVADERGQVAKAAAELLEETVGELKASHTNPITGQIDDAEVLDVISQHDFVIHQLRALCQPAEEGGKS